MCEDGKDEDRDAASAGAAAGLSGGGEAGAEVTTGTTGLSGGDAEGLSGRGAERAASPTGRDSAGSANPSDGDAADAEGTTGLSGGGEAGSADRSGMADSRPGPGEDDERFMRMALEQARLAAAEGEVPIGAVVACGGEAVAAARNRREGDADPSAHAELLAMVEASRRLGRWRLSGCTVYVTLEPCLMCAGLMVNARIDRCVYGAPDPKGGALGTLYDVSHDPRLNHEFEVTPGVLQEECAEELRAFFRRRRAEARAAKKEG